MLATTSIEKLRAVVAKSSAFLFLSAALVSASLVLGATPASAQDDPGDLGEGLEIYGSQGCAGCHGTDGAGSAAGRSLIDIAVEQPDRAVHLASVTNGKGSMPAYGSRLTEAEVSAVVSYVRLTFLSEEDAIDELPNTGLSSWLFVAGFGLIGVGGIAVLAVEPATRIRLANR
jgi:mono/diheme cytochrome c family protein